MQRVLVLIACLAATCSGAHGGEIEDLYQPLEGGKPAPAVETPVETAPHTHGVTDVGLERTPCYGTCPVYTVIIHADGSFRYHGQAHVPRKGDFTGHVNPFQLDRLTQFIKDSGYMELASSYRAPVTDNPTVYTLVRLDGKRKIIRDYAGAGPPKLWAVEQLIDKLIADATWDDPDSKSHRGPTTRPTTDSGN